MSAEAGSSVAQPISVSVLREREAITEGKSFLPSSQARVDLSSYTVAGFDRGAGRIREMLWHGVSLFLFQLCPFKLSALKALVLRGFGARVGRRVVIKPEVKITFPWKLELGDDVWLGEECWLLNLEKITIGSNVCVSQRAFLCTGNHDYSSTTFDLIVKPIAVENGAWLGAGCWVGPGVTIKSHAVLTAGSVAVKSLKAWSIYQGNPAIQIKQRILRNPPG